MEKTFKCVRCQGNFPWASAQETAYIPSLGRRYVCPECAVVKGYSTSNEMSVHSETQNRFAVGIEWECVPFDKSCEHAMCSGHYALIPTHDSSLPQGGVEFKSPMYRNLSALKSSMRSWLKFSDVSDPKCSQHINFSAAFLTPNVCRAILQPEHVHLIFDPLRFYMKCNPDETIRVCGKNFSWYANEELDYSEHNCWLNLSHMLEQSGRMEWRLAKVQNANQYFWLINMCLEILKAIENNFAKYVEGEKTIDDVNVIRHKAELTGNKIVKIFKKYAEGKASCQSEKRNTK